MMHFMDRVKVLQQMMAQAANSDFAKQMATVLTRDLPLWLAEVDALSPADLRDVSEGLDLGLTNLIRVCTEEQKSLRTWRAPSALTLKLALDRISGAIVPLESSLARYALALRRTDPRMAAIGLAFAAVAPTMATDATPLAAASVSAPLAVRSSGEYRKVAEAIRQTLHDTVAAATCIQQGLHGTHGRDAAMVAGVIEQMRTLLAWLSQQQERHAGTLVQRERSIAH